MSPLALAMGPVLILAGIGFPGTDTCFVGPIFWTTDLFLWSSILDMIEGSAVAYRLCPLIVDFGYLSFSLLMLIGEVAFVPLMAVRAGT